jgi:hypothetical protein
VQKGLLWGWWCPLSSKLVIDQIAGPVQGNYGWLYALC